MRINLNVPFTDKDTVKRRGALWDPARKTWYVENHSQLELFLKWMPKHLLKPS